MAGGGPVVMIGAVGAGRTPGGTAIAGGSSDGAGGGVCRPAKVGTSGGGPGSAGTVGPVGEVGAPGAAVAAGRAHGTDEMRPPSSGETAPLEAGALGPVGRPCAAAGPVSSEADAAAGAGVAAVGLLGRQLVVVPSSCSSSPGRSSSASTRRCSSTVVV